MAKAYFGSKISPNMMKTPEEFLICYNVPIARTGVQKYLGREIGLDGNQADEIVRVYRIEEEVFDSKTIASFEGKVFTDEHPNDWVTPQNFSTYAKGSITNVRRGKGEEKDLLLADIIVYNQLQIDEIERKQKREVSCGYECEYVPYKDGYLQKNIIGNHVALVSAGRAGSRVAIKDNDATSKTNKGGNKMGYKIPRRSKVSDFFQAVGLKHVAMDAEPEDILDAVNEMVEEKAKEQMDAEAVNAPQGKPITAGFEGATVSDADEEIENIKSALSDVKDALDAMMEENMAEDDEPEDEGFMEDADCEEGMEALDELEDELVNDYDEVAEIESVEEDPEVINADEDEAEEMTQVSDSAIELMNVLRPIIAAIPDARQRKKVSDNLANTLRKQVKDSKKKSSDSVYGKIVNGRKAKDSAMDSQDYGKMIAEKYNPHYNKEVK